MTGAQDSGAPLFAEVFGGRAASLSVNWVGP
jgi:hypothetical protein